MTKLAVLVSGRGSIMESMIKAGIDITIVLADRPCQAVDMANKAGVKAEIVDRQGFGFGTGGWDRIGYTEAVVNILKQQGIGLIAMAGFMTILEKPMFEAYGGKILNTHPSLLPAFKGDHAVRDALAYGVKITGCTIHEATMELDAGPIVAQQAVEVLPDDTEESLHERIKTVERKLYPEVLQRLMV